MTRCPTPAASSSRSRSSRAIGTTVGQLFSAALAGQSTRRRRARPGPVGRDPRDDPRRLHQVASSQRLAARPTPGGPFPRRLGPSTARREPAMATRQPRSIARLMRAPAIILLLIWMIVPLAMTLYFSFRNYNLLTPRRAAGPAGSTTVLPAPTRPSARRSGTRWCSCSACCSITVIGGIAHRLLIDQPIFGQGIVRILVISPFFVMPPVAALVWKNMIMHPGLRRLRRHRQVLRGAAGRLVRPATRCSRSSSSSPGSGCPSPR